MNIKQLAIASLASLAFFACDNHRVQVSDTGLKYQIHQQNDNGKKAKIGDIMTLQLVLKSSRDTVIRDTYKEGRPLQIMLQTAPFKGSFEEGLTMLSKGDSATFFVSADSLFTKMGQPLPKDIDKGSDIKFTVKVLDVQNEQDFQKGMLQKRDQQKAADTKIIDEYIGKNGLKTTKTASGLHYIVVKEGTGAKPTAGQVVSVHYVGKLINGKEFDSSYKNPQSGGKPVDFPIGQQMVIPGWEEGIMNMRKGGKSTFIIPSALGYGEAGVPNTIPANSVLVFEVELIDIKKAQQ